jgi:hypothetical protein
VTGSAGRAGGVEGGRIVRTDCVVTAAVARNGGRVGSVPGGAQAVVVVWAVAARAVVAASAATTAVDPSAAAKA